MPMPPPKASSEGPRDRGVAREIEQIVRALQAEGPQSSEGLSQLVGARFWEEGRFAKALSLAQSDGRVIATNDGRFSGV